MSEAHFREVGATATVTKQISEADVALFGLVTKDDLMNGDDPPPPVRQPRQAAPFPMLAAVLASAAARHLPRPDLARFERQVVEFAAPAYTDDTLSATAEIAAYDRASGSLRIRAHCDNQEGVRLAEGEFILKDE
ncbi:MAG TPA: hypothetical protein VKQ30_19785 [Ktedonobacterales bacterium]|nr:hypothetical protein [Ktedonobacterales bacterium]